MHSATILAILSFGLAPLASAHCKITAATGDKGGKSSGLAVNMATGTNQADTTIFNQKTGFGKTNGGGQINPASALPAAMKFAGSNELAQVTPGGTLSMTVHQLNGDGAGPMACSISTDASGKTWTNIQVGTNTPGKNGRSNANNQNFPLTATIPTGTQCTGSVGGQTGVCMVKCQNPVGPFGGTVAIQMAGANATEEAAGQEAGAGAGTATNAAAAATTSTAGKKNKNGKNSKNAKANNRRDDEEDDDTSDASLECTDEACATFDDSDSTATKRDDASAGSSDPFECTTAACLDFDDSDSTATKRAGPVAVRAILEGKQQ